MSTGQTQGVKSIFTALFSGPHLVKHSINKRISLQEATALSRSPNDPVFVECNNFEGFKKNCIVAYSSSKNKRSYQGEDWHLGAVLSLHPSLIVIARIKYDSNDGSYTAEEQPESFDKFKGDILKVVYLNKVSESSVAEDGKISSSSSGPCCARISNFGDLNIPDTSKLDKGLNDDAMALVKDAVVKSIPTLADQLVPVLVPKLCDALVPVLAPKLAEAVLPMLKTARSTSTSDPAKTKAEHEELHWPQMTNSKKGSFIVGCPFNGGFEKCELLRTGLANKKLKREELRVHGENCNDCRCHYFVKLTVTEEMFNKDKTLEAFKDVSDLTMAYRALDYKTRLGGPEAKIWMASTSNKVAKSDLKKHLNAFHKLDDVEIKSQFPMLIDRLRVKKEKE